MNRPTRQRLRWIAVLLLIAAIFIAGRLIEIDQYLQAAQEWIWSIGPWGPTVYALIYVVSMLLLLPGTPFTIFAALLFGPLWGFFIMLAGTNLAAVSAFFIARYLARSEVERHLAGAESFRRLREIAEPTTGSPFPLSG